MSAVIAIAAASVVFALWYPWPYRLISGGQELFILLISVDLILGPLLTFAVFDRTKNWSHLRRDLAVIGGLQLLALVYGAYVVYSVRPVALVFETDRFRVIATVDVRGSELQAASAAYQNLPLTGPWVLGTRQPRDDAERKEAFSLSMSGFDSGQRPSYWQPYAQSQGEALAKSRPIAVLADHYANSRAQIEAIVRGLVTPADQVRFVPMRARRDWVVLVDNVGNIVGFAPFDGFF